MIEMTEDGLRVRAETPAIERDAHIAYLPNGWRISGGPRWRASLPQTIVGTGIISLLIAAATLPLLWALLAASLIVPTTAAAVWGGSATFGGPWHERAIEHRLTIVVGREFFIDWIEPNDDGRRRRSQTVALNAVEDVRANQFEAGLYVRLRGAGGLDTTLLPDLPRDACEVIGQRVMSEVRRRREGGGA